MILDITTTIDAGAAVVRVVGEVDVSNADELRDAIDAALVDGGVESVTVDLSDMPYIDSTGIGVLVGAAHKARDAGRVFSAANPQSNVARIMGLLGVGEVIDIKMSQQE